MKALRKNGNLNIYSSISTGQTPSADEVHVIRWKAPELQLNRARGELVVSKTVRFYL